MKHNFVASYRLDLPFAEMFRRNNRLTDGWSLSGTARFSTGLPVTLYDDSDDSLLGTLGNGINNDLLDTPNYNGGPLNVDTNPRNGRPEFNTVAITPEGQGANGQPVLGVLGDASRRFFYVPGISNFDMTLAKRLRINGSKSFEFRLEAFNVFNHAQFYGAASVDGEVNDPNFGRVVSAAAPRLVQLATKFTF